MAGPDDEQVEAPTFYGGDPLRITEGALLVTRPPKRGRKMQGSMHVSGTYRWLKKGGPWGVSIFDGGGASRARG
jgi:hypothetical protein